MWVPESSSTHQRGGRSLSLVRYQILSNHVGTGRSQLAASARAVRGERLDEAPSLHRAVAVEKGGRTSEEVDDAGVAIMHCEIGFRLLRTALPAYTLGPELRSHENHNSRRCLAR
ncbi:hypothetical protein SCHPADRAFT_750377 [Schizopora paradoxa]|uniref:Uncharacterized protein n=1 Tax=Schizopora paradoxa TaxID=27342 RepID=A0A0H2QZY0_9AGAM|nr:hypothetical protein SCHPADRAFT_750377 [Schizopora paradoxa]